MKHCNLILFFFKKEPDNGASSESEFCLSGISSESESDDNDELGEHETISSIAIDCNAPTNDISPDSVSDNNNNSAPSTSSCQSTGSTDSVDINGNIFSCNYSLKIESFHSFFSSTAIKSIEDVSATSDKDIEDLITVLTKASSKSQPKPSRNILRSTFEKIRILVNIGDILETNKKNRIKKQGLTCLESI